MRLVVDVVGESDGRRTVRVLADSGPSTPIDLELGRHDVDVVEVDGRSLPVLAVDPGNPAAMADALGRIEDRAIGAGDVELVGRALFDLALRPAWSAIRARAGPGPILVALRWPSTDHAFTALPWEVMNDGEEFLATRRDNLIALARCVAGASAAPIAESAPVPRVLFVVGASLEDETIRPGAELMGLMREFERSGANSQGSIESRLIESASIRSLADTVRTFRPTCVHIVAHGDRDTMPPNEVGVRLAGELCTADQLAEVLRWPPDPATGTRRLPDLIVISACESGGNAVTTAREFNAPLAARLVDAGVPIVVGMAGEVGERACRLFGRKFGESMLRGEMVVVSAAHGRRAAFVEGSSPPTLSIDWALPAAFVSDRVALDHVAIPPSPAQEVARNLTRALYLTVSRTEPVFCGRDAFLADLDDVISGDSMVLVAWAASLGGLGEERLIRELSRRALHRGFLPVDVEDNPAGVPPKTATDLALDILRGIAVTARNIALPVFSSRVLAKLGRSPAGDDVDWGDVISQAALARNGQQEDPGTLRGWLTDDFRSLMGKAQESYPDVFGPASRPIVSIHKIHNLANVVDALVGEKSSRLIGPEGLGGINFSVPVLMTASTGEGAGAGAKVADARSHRPDGWHYEELQSFRRRQGDGRIIHPYYLWVLLNPRPGAAKEAELVFAPMRGKDNWRDQFDQSLTGSTDDFNERLYLIVRTLAGVQEFSRNNDEDALSTYADWAGT